MIRAIIVIAAGLAFAAALPAISTRAAARDRVFVASYGSDTNPCTFGSPCKTFQNAFNVVAAGGEVTAIDSAGFGPLAITKSVIITSPAGVEAGIVPAAPGDDAIDIDSTSAITVTLRGLTVEGAGSGLNGVNFTTSVGFGTLEIIDCKFDNFTNDGVLLQSANNAGLNVTISNTYAVNNGHDGIEVTGNFANVVISSTYAFNNANDGIEATGNNSYATISNSIAAYNKNNGFEFHNEMIADLSNVDAEANSRQGIYVGTVDTVSVIKNSRARLNNINDLTVNSGGAILINNNDFYSVLINNTDATASADGTNYFGSLNGTVGSQGLH